MRATWLTRVLTAVSTCLSAIVLIALPGASPAQAGFNENIVPLTPARLLDTRETFGGPVEGGHTQELKVTGREGVADNAAAVALNVTAVLPAGPGFLAVFPCGSPRPTTSNVNYVPTADRPGVVVPNSVLAKVGDGGQVCIYASTTTHVLVDVNGYVPQGGAPTTVVPRRLLETRPRPNATFDGQHQNVGRVGAGSTVAFQVAGRGPVPATAEAAYLNVTAIRPGGRGYLTVFPCDTERPGSSNVNYTANAVVANAVLTAVGDDGRVCIYTHAAVDIAVDVNGYFLPGGGRQPIAPVRCADTRTGPDIRTFDGLFRGNGKVGPTDAYAVQVAGRCRVPADATAVFANITAVGAEGNGYLTAFPCGVERPTASNVNYMTGDTVPNAVLATISPGDGTICVYSHARVHLIVDITGYVPADNPRLKLIEAHQGRSSAIDRDGRIDSWGGGQLPYHLFDGELDPVIDVDRQGATACAVRANGTGWCWGDNDGFLLGTGNTDESYEADEPQQIDGPTDITQLDLAEGADNHACAISGGDVWCWGDNFNGRLGVSASGDYPSPVQAEGLPANAVEVSVGYFYFTCARFANGRVWCWGNNQDHQLGRGDTPGSLTGDPGPVTGLTDVVDLATGSYTACALKSNGTVWCWGDELRGELGNGGDTDDQAPVPEQVPGIANAVSIDMESTSACAVLADGSVKCWGRSVDDQYGTGDGHFGASFASPIDITGLQGSAAQVSLGIGITCVLLENGQVMCSGRVGTAQSPDNISHVDTMTLIRGHR